LIISNKETDSKFVAFSCYTYITVSFDTPYYTDNREKKM